MRETKKLLSGSASGPVRGCCRRALNAVKDFWVRLQDPSQGNTVLWSVIGMFAVLGFYLVVNTRAATSDIAVESENGTLSAGAAAVNDPSASGGKAVAFGAGAAPAAPSGLQAVAGGPSIALIWNPLAPPASVSYTVYRNSIKIASVAPDPENADPVYTSGSRYIDTSITPGAAYKYKVQAVDTASGQASPYSTVLSVTAPTDTTPAPAITTDTSAAPDLADWLNNAVVPELKIWYPKEADYLAYPTYSPPSSFKLKFVSGMANPAEAHWDIDQIYLSPDWFRANKDDIAAVIHESAHLVQHDSGIPYPSWTLEGIASWVSMYLYQDNSKYGTPKLPSHSYDSYSDGYGTTAYFLQWIQNQGHPGFIRNMNIAIHRQTYSTDSFFTAQLGKTADQEWTAMTGHPLTSGPITNTGYLNVCLDDWASSTAAGNKVDNYACNNSDAQHWYRLRQADGTNILKVFNMCLDDTSSGTADGNPVQIYYCNGSGAQQWNINSNHTITNVVSGKCLFNGGGNTAWATQLTIKTCDARDPGQQWLTP